MRKATKKLTLNRETIGQMEDGALAGAVGMSTVPACMSTACPTIRFPCRSAIFCVTGGCASETGCLATANC